jgi:hypothetical protein
MTKQPPTRQRNFARWLVISGSICAQVLDEARQAAEMVGPMAYSITNTIDANCVLLEPPKTIEDRIAERFDEIENASGAMIHTPISYPFQHKDISEWKNFCEAHLEKNDNQVFSRRTQGLATEAATPAANKNTTQPAPQSSTRLFPRLLPCLLPRFLPRQLPRSLQRRSKPTVLLRRHLLRRHKQESAHTVPQCNQANAERGVGG